MSQIFLNSSCFNGWKIIISSKRFKNSGKNIVLNRSRTAPFKSPVFSFSEFLSDVELFAFLISFSKN
jgi:hypothetical protein